MTTRRIKLISKGGKRKTRKTMKSNNRKRKVTKKSRRGGAPQEDDNASKPLSGEVIQRLKEHVQSISGYRNHPNFQKLLSSISKIKYNPEYVHSIDGYEFEGPNKEYNQALDKIEDFFSSGGRYITYDDEVVDITQ